MMKNDRVPGQLHLTSASESIQLAAAEGDGENKLRRFSGIAYTGVKVNLSGWGYPVVVDLTGIAVAKKSRPILRDHDTGKVVGHTESVTITPRTISVEGVISGANEFAAEISASSDNGFPWQMSIGASPSKVIFLEEGETASVNGRKVSGPAYIVRQSVLNEVSFVALGADDHTSAQVAASAASTTIGVITMTFDTWLKDKGFEDGAALSEKAQATLKAQFDAEQSPPEGKTKPQNVGQQRLEEEFARVQAKAERDGKIAEVAAEAIANNPFQATEIKALADMAMTANKDPEKFELELLRSTRPQTGGAGIVRKSSSNLTGKVLEAAICMEGRLPTLEDRFDDQTLQAARDQFRHGIKLGQLFAIAATQNGYHGDMHNITIDMQRAAFGMSGPQSIRASSGFSTLSLPGILSNVANKFLEDGWGGGDMAWTNIARVKPVKDFKQNTSYRLNGSFKYEKVGPGGELKHGTVSETSYSNKADTYGKMFALTREDYINDDLGAFMEIATEMGVGAIDAFNEIFWAAFLNNSSFFSSGHNNVSTGAGSALALAGLSAAEAVFTKQTKPNGQPLAVLPEVLLVPPELKATAWALMGQGGATLVVSGANATIPNGNVWAGKFKVVSSPYMSNSSFTGYSAAAWYLLANPNRMPTIVASFLNGRTAPIIESADADFNVLGTQFRGYHDFGADLWEFRGGVRSAGS